MPNAHQNILTDSIKPEELEVANLFDVSGRVAIGASARRGSSSALESLANYQSLGAVLGLAS